jgi:apolipoprotein N-acyltransferase
MARPSSTRQLAAPALALGAGFLVALALPPWGFWPLAIVGVMCLEVALGSHPSRRRRFVFGVLFGLSWMSMGMGWMWHLSAPGHLVATALFAALHGVAALVAPTGRWRVIGRPAAHTLVEALRLSFPFGGVPLATLAMSQVGGPLIGVARVAGVVGLTWVVFQLGFALAGPSPTVPAMVRRGRPGTTGSWLGMSGFAAVLLLVVLAAVAPTGSPTGRTLTIAAVQGGGEQGTTALEVPSALVFERHLDATRSIEPDPDLDLVLWPENVIRVRREPFEGSAIHDAVAGEAARLGVPLAVGITEDADVTGRGDVGQVTNAQVVVAPDGRIISRYDKVRRVPFGEYVPLRNLLEALGAPVDQVRTNAVPGTDPAVLELPDGTTTAVVISWEVFFGGRTREGVEAGGEVVLNPTNGASYTGTILQTQQVASSRLRAVETGRWVVQAAPTGFSGFITADGEVIHRTGVSERAVVTESVELRTGSTWYRSIGDGPLIVLLLATLGASIWCAWARERWQGRRDRPRPSDLDQNGDRSVVDDVDAHVGAETSGRDGGAAFTQ